MISDSEDDEDFVLPAAKRSKSSQEKVPLLQNERVWHCLGTVQLGTDQQNQLKACHDFLGTKFILAILRKIDVAMASSK